MNKPFVFGKETSAPNFTDREMESKHLTANFENGVNTILISPRRWGKTSLVKKVAQQINNRNIKTKVVLIDAFMCRTEEDFLNVFATEVIKQTSGKLEEWLENTKQFLSRLSPKLSIGTDSFSDFSLSLDFIEKTDSIIDILDLPQQLAIKRNIQIVICIDEFQQVAEYHHANDFQKKLRSIWQKQQSVSYCLYGSKMHLLSTLFSKRSLPFYKFGEVFYLQKIPTNYWVEYICSRFNATGKKISESLANEICTVVDNHSSYVQQLSWLVWTKTETTATASFLTEAIDDLLNQNAILYYKETESLTSYQLNFLRALVNGVYNGFTTQKVLNQYKLGTSANISRIKKSLEDKELIDISGKKVSIADPVFALWLKQSMGF